jgi:hypothetical protein
MGFFSATHFPTIHIGQVVEGVEMERAFSTMELRKGKLTDASPDVFPVRIIEIDPMRTFNQSHLPALAVSLYPFCFAEIDLRLVE